MPGTAFVIGAGASCCYELPTAKELKTLVCREPPAAPRGFQRFLSDPELWHDHYSAFSQQLERSGQYSVDRFLEVQPKHSLVGKYAIAHSLQVLEARALSRPSLCSGWLQWLFNATARRLRANQWDGICFITFNYDRLLEYSLGTMAMNSFGLTADQAEESVMSVPVTHVYGTLATTPYADFQSRFFDADCGPQSAEQAVYKLFTIGDAGGREFADTAKRMLEAADRVVFLGFGYDRANLKHIGISKENPAWAGRNRTVIGTAHGLTPRERKDAEALLANQSTVRFGAVDHDCERVLRDFIEPDSLAADT